MLMKGEFDKPEDDSNKSFRLSALMISAPLPGKIQ